VKRWGAWLAVLLIGSACGDDASSGGTAGTSTGEPSSTTNNPTTNAESSSSSTGADGSGSSTTTGSPTGPSSCSGTCAPEVPAGWTGPVKVGNNAVDCNGGFADPAGAFFTDFDPGEKECMCDCQAGDAACADTVEVQVYGDTGCVGEPDYTFDLGMTACTPFEGPFPPALDDMGGAATLSMDFFTIGPVVVDGACEGTAMFNEGGFLDSVQLCAPTAEPSLCDDGGPCIADNSDVCVWQEGEQECPDGYPVATLGYSGSNDERECGACDCGTASGVCDSSIALQTDACGAGTTVTNADCINSGAGAITAATYDPGTALFECSGGTGTAPISGTVEPTDPITICCVE
jgi:hypothetical protein